MKLPFKTVKPRRTAKATEPRQTKDWLIGWSGFFVAVVIVGAFVVSFAVLRDLAERFGIPAGVAWIWPVIVDGTIAAATAVLYASRHLRLRERVLPSLTLALFVVVSLVGNVAHNLAIDVGDSRLKIFVSSVPPIGLLLSVELFITLLRVRGQRVDVVSEPALVTPVSVPVPEQAPELAPSAEPLTSPAEDMSVAPDPAIEPPNDPVSEVESELEPAAEAVLPADDSTEGTDSSLEAELAPLARLHAVEREDAIPTEKGDQIDWVIAQAQAGEDVTRERLAERLGVSVRTAQRRLAEARELAPEAFAEPAEAEDLQKVS